MIILIIAGLVITYWKKLFLTYSLILVNAIVFLMIAGTSAMTFWGGSRYSMSYIEYDLAFNPSYLLNGRNLYSLITSMYLHSNLLHFIFNAFALFTIGLHFEEKVGTLRFGIIFYSTGVIAGLLYALSTNFQNLFLMGASGGLFGIIGAYAILYPRERFAFIPIPYPLPIYTWAFIFFIGSLILHFIPGICFIPNVAHLAHAMGLFAGIKKRF